MDKHNAENLAQLANLGKGNFSLSLALKFLEKFLIGKEGVALLGMSYSGIRFAPQEDGKEIEFVFLSPHDIEKAKAFSMSLSGSINIDESIRQGKQILITENDLKSLKFNLIYEEKWANHLCSVLKHYSKDAQEFLKNIISSNNKKPGRQREETPEKIELLITESINTKFQHFLKRNASCVKIDEKSINYSGKNLSIPTIKFMPSMNNYATIEDELNAKFFISPFLEGAKETWLKARLCAECGNFFFYKQARAQYCSQRCRMAVANRQRRGK